MNRPSTAWILAAAFVFWLTGPGTAHAFELNGFADVSYTATEMGGATGGSNNGFSLGHLDFYVAEQLSDRMDMLAELVTELDDGEAITDLERLQISYALNNHHKVRAGRFHNLLGYWNLAYHHGAQLHTTIGRPFFLEFEDEHGVLPMHMVGLWWDSRFSTDAGNVRLGVMFGNGAALSGDLSVTPELLELDPGSGSDPDNQKAVSANLSFSPAALEGLQVGLFGQTGTVLITDTGGPLDDEIDQIIWGVDVAYLSDRVEFLGEYYAWQHENLASVSTDTVGWYTQLGYRVKEQVMPYVRYSTLDAESDPYFDAIGVTTPAVDRETTVTVVGIRFDIDYRTALKAEYRAIDDDFDGSYNEAAAQWAFSF